MGKIEIDIPKGLESAFDEAFPAHNRAAEIWRVLEAELRRRVQVSPERS